MIEFYSYTKRPIKKPTPSGEKYITTYQEQIEDGIKTLVISGYTNTDEIIQRDFESTKIENILHRVLMGDMEALNQRDGVYCDATTMPKNLMAAQNLMLKMKSEFEKMPTEVKEIFHNSADKYIEEMGTEEFNRKMAPYNEKIAKIAEEENHAAYLKKVKEGAKLNYDIKREEAALGGEK